jgi:hypothetical protein
MTKKLYDHSPDMMSQQTQYDLHGTVRTLKLLRCFVEETGVLLGSVFTATRPVKLLSHKLILVHELMQPVCIARIHVCNRLLQNMQDRVIGPQLLRETTPYLSGHISMQNV